MKKLYQIGLIVGLSIGAVMAEEAPKEDDPQKVKAKTGHPFSWGFLKWDKMQPYGGKTKGSETVTITEHRESYQAIYEDGLSAKERDLRAIKSLVGDYRVSFDFIETAGTAENYTPQRPYFSWATEKVFVIEEREDFISLQHIIVMEFVDEEGNIQGPFTMKHWRQDWRYQDQTEHIFLGDRQWQQRDTSHLTSHKWTQEVYQVDDSPRYEAIGTWNHEGGLSTFTTDSFWRPLPRREFSIRLDYNVLAGFHQIIINPTGWVHLQNNRKSVVENGKIVETLATEVGAVRYESISQPDLSPALTYWEKTAPYWQAVREKWDQVRAENPNFTLASKVDDQSLFMHHFTHAGEIESAEQPDYAKGKADAEAIIDRFLAAGANQ